MAKEHERSSLVAQAILFVLAQFSAAGEGARLVAPRHLVHALETHGYEPKFTLSKILKKKVYT